MYFGISLNASEFLDISYIFILSYIIDKTIFIDITCLLSRKYFKIDSNYTLFQFIHITSLELDDS